MQATIHGDDLPGGFAQTVTDQQKISLGLIHELSRNETMQWRVNGTGAWIQIEYRVIVSRYHLVFRLRFQTFVAAHAVGFLQANQLGLVERRKIFARSRPQIAARTFDPKHSTDVRFLG